jgi:hypothetical protein
MSLGGFAMSFGGFDMSFGGFATADSWSNKKVEKSGG